MTSIQKIKNTVCVRVLFNIHSILRLDKKIDANCCIVTKDVESDP